MRAFTLSESAVALLRFEIKGYRIKTKNLSRLEAYHELVAAGIMEPVPAREDEFRFTEAGMTDREVIALRETERIELGRHEPPDTSNLSVAAKDLLRTCIEGGCPDGDELNRPAYRELVKARIVIPVDSFTKSDECVFRFTPLGWRNRFEILKQVAG